ncbi:hypothetical protein Pmani_028668 [Petrolisthes manimaculis]|uniref:Uncharacterized protein n=1 Tax=Petrolisthes manimaculis TaxID=1843537 RepID=A0AAE1P1M4_9EUCA|nr:hypothetical protein Pmani_028668 [Petrolisthes manimaculis]
MATHDTTQHWHSGYIHTRKMDSVTNFTLSSTGRHYCLATRPTHMAALHSQRNRLPGCPATKEDLPTVVSYLATFTICQQVLECWPSVQVCGG